MVFYYSNRNITNIPDSIVSQNPPKAVFDGLCLQSQNSYRELGRKLRQQNHPEAHRSTCEYTVQYPGVHRTVETPGEIRLSGWEGGHQSPKLSFDLHIHVMAPACPHSHTPALTIATKIKDQTFNYQGWHLCFGPVIRLNTTGEAHDRAKLLSAWTVSEKEEGPRVSHLLPKLSLSPNDQKTSL